MNLGRSSIISCSGHLDSGKMLLLRISKFGIVTDPRHHVNAAVSPNRSSPKVAGHLIFRFAAMALTLFALPNQQAQAQNEPWLNRFPVDTALLANDKNELLALWYASPLSKTTTNPTFLWFYWLKFDLPDTNRASFTEEQVLSSLRFNPYLYYPYKQKQSWFESIFSEERTDSTRCIEGVGINLCILGDAMEPVASIPPWNENMVWKYDTLSLFENMLYSCYVIYGDQFVFYPICSIGLVEGRWFASIDKDGGLVWYNTSERKRYTTKEIRDTRWKKFFISWFDE